MVRVIFIFYFIFLFGLVGGMELTASPEEIVFEAEVGEVICENLSIEAEGFSNILVEDRWAEVGFMDRKLSKHKLESEELGLNVVYVEELSVGETGVLEICLDGEKFGNFHGVLLLRGERVSAGVGVWLVVNLEEGEGVIDKLGSRVGGITGGVVVIVGEGVGVGLILVLFLVFVVVLEVFILVRRGKKLIIEDKCE